MATSTLTVTRQGHTIYLRRKQFEVLVDGTSIGSIENDHTVDFPLEPGHHALQLRSGRYSSTEDSFDVADGEVVNFRCHGARFFLEYVASTLKPSIAISLKQE